MGLDQYKSTTPNRLFIKDNTFRVGPSSFWCMYFQHIQNTIIENNVFTKMPIGFKTIASSPTSITIETDIPHGMTTGQNVYLRPFMQGGISSPYDNQFGPITRISNTQFSINTTLGGFPTGELFTNKTYDAIAPAIWIRSQSQSPDWLGGKNSNHLLKGNVFEVTNPIQLMNCLAVENNWVGGSEYRREGNAIATMTKSGNIVTVTTPSAHNLSNNQYIQINGAFPYEYNGFYKITITSPTTFTYVLEKTIATTATTRGIVRTIKQELINFPKNEIHYNEEVIQIASVAPGPNIPGSGNMITITTTVPHNLVNSSLVKIEGLIPNYWSTTLVIYNSTATTFEVFSSSFTGTQATPQLTMSYSPLDFLSWDSDNNTDEKGIELYSQNIYGPIRVRGRYGDPILNGIALDRAIRITYPIYGGDVGTYSSWTNCHQILLIEPGHYILPQGIDSLRYFRKFIGTSSNPNDVVIETAKDTTTNPSYGTFGSLIVDFYPYFNSFENMTFISARDSVLGPVWSSNGYGLTFKNCIFKNNSAGSGAAFKDNLSEDYSGLTQFINCVFECEVTNDPARTFHNIGGFFNCIFKKPFKNIIELFIVKDCRIVLDLDKFIYTSGIIENCVIFGNTNNCYVQLNSSSPTNRGKIFKSVIKNANVINGGELYFTTIEPSSTQTYSLIGTHTVYNVGATKPKDPSATITTLTNII
jgi:hypothetical protein